MTESPSSPDRRAQITAVVGLLFQVAFFVALLLVGLVNRSDAVLAAARWMLGGVIIWPALALIYGQRRRTLIEKREAEELKRTRTAEGVAAIFDTEDETYLIERRRLNWMLRWLLPSAILLLAAYHLLIALAPSTWRLLGWHWSWGASLRDPVWRMAENRGVTMTFVGGVGFLAFLFSRYTGGMARIAGWRMLRAGASYLAGNALACLVVLIAIGIPSSSLPIAQPLAAYAIRVALLVLGIEFIINLMLDYYRPRIAGEEARPAFDSRLLALVTEPGGIARSLADAINYQFGFEVSSTWFYQLLKRAIMPMMAFGVVVVFALSSVVVLDADEQAVVERFGKRLQRRGEALAPGIHLKFPAPIESAYTAHVDRVRTFTVGEAPKEETQYEKFNGKMRLKPILWGEKHEFNAELMVVLASEAHEGETRSSATEPLSAEAAKDESTPAALLMISVDIQYRVKDIHDYLYTFANPERVVENIAYQVLTDFAAGVTEERFLGPGRTEVNEVLTRKLQQRIDELQLGIEVLFVAVQEAHPSDKVAGAYQDVVKAEIGMEAAIENARKAADTELTNAAGSRSVALRLDRAIVERDRLAQVANADPEQRAEADQAVQDLLVGHPDKDIKAAGGDAAKRIAEAKTRVWASIAEAETDRALFEAEVSAFEAAPQVYRMRKYLDTLEKATSKIRKYVVLVDPAKNVIVEYEKEDKSTIELEDLGSQ